MGPRMLGVSGVPLILQFTVLGPPVGKERPRVTPHGTYTPKRTRMYEATIYGMAQLRVPRDWPLDARYWLHVGFTGRCDGDNVRKAVADALEGVCYHNDRQIDKGSDERITGTPRTEITIEVLAA